MEVHVMCVIETDCAHLVYEMMRSLCLCQVRTAHVGYVQNEQKERKNSTKSRIHLLHAYRGRDVNPETVAVVRSTLNTPKVRIVNVCFTPLRKVY